MIAILADFSLIFKLFIKGFQMRFVSSGDNAGYVQRSTFILPSSCVFR